MKAFFLPTQKLFFILLLLFAFRSSLKAQLAAECVNFNGANNYITTSSVAFGTNWTIEGWIRPTNINSIYWNAVMGQVFYNNNQGFVIAIFGGEVFLDGPQAIYMSSPITSGAWVHVAATYNNGIVAFYKNGLLVGTKVATVNSSTTPFLIGARTGNGGTGLMDAYQGDMDEIRIWNVTRTQCEILSYMNCEIPTVTTGLISNYHFNQGFYNTSNAGLSTLLDVSGYAHHGAMSNFALTGLTSNWTAPGGVITNSVIPFSPLPEINIRGNGTSIADGSSAPVLSNHTDFGTAGTRTFVVENIGTHTLNLGIPVFTGTNPSEFSVSVPPSSLIAASTGTTSFVVAFTPTSLGVKSTRMYLYNSDCSEPYYDFVITATAVAGAALSFDGTDDYVETNANLAELAQADFAIEAWIKTTGVSQGIVTCANSNTTWETGEKCLYLDASGIPRFVGFGNGYIYGNMAVNNGAWHHIAVTWDYIMGSTGTGKIYIDGVDRTGIVSYVPTNANVGTFKIGKQNYNNFTPEAPNNFNGQIDEVRVWNRVLCLPEIINNMSCELPSPGTQLGLNGYYRFNSGIGFGLNTGLTTATDDAVYTNHGTLVNFGLAGGPSSNWISPGAVTSGVSCSVYLYPEINVRGNGVNIPNLDMSPSLTDNTDFGQVGLGSVISKTFVIQNTGTTSLSLSGYNLSGANASEFTVVSNPGNSITAAGSGTVVISFSATTLGLRTASFTILNSDCDEATTRFVINATAVTPAAALNLDGTDDYVNLSDPNFGMGDFTIETWVKPNAIGGYILTSRNFEQGPGGSWWSLSYGNQTVASELADTQVASSYAVPSTAPGSVPLGVWTHVAMVRSGKEVRYYVNGILSYRHQDSFVRDFNKPANTLDLGAWSYNGAARFNGSVDELRLWTVARTQCEIQTYMKCEIPSNATNLVGNYHFNQGLPAGANPGETSLTDVSGSNRTGTLHHFSLTGATSNWITPGGVVSGSTAVNTPTVEMDVRGNGNSIIDGNTGTSPVDFTDFNGALTRTFTIHNIIAGGTLNTYTPYLSGTDASQFSITTVPASAIAGVGTTSFVVSFFPSSSGVKNASVNILGNDCSEPIYDFAITATTTSGEALNFDNSNDRVIVPPGIILNNTSFSIEFLAKRANSSSDDYVVGIGSAIGTNTALHIGFRPGNVATFAFYSNDINYTTTAASDGNYHHWACVYDASITTGKNRFLYLDGVLVASDLSAPLLATGPLIIGDAGYYANFPNPYGGDIDELRIWNTVRSQCEIQTYMNCQITSTATGLTANYHFDQGIAAGSNPTVTTLTDATGNGHDGTLTNFALSGGTSNWMAPGAIPIGYTTSNPPTATLAIEGNGNAIAAGSTSPLLSNFTDFGTVTTRTLVMRNLGIGPLYLNGGTFVGANASNFSVTTTPSSVIPTGGSSTFVISFTPTAAGSQSATLRVLSSDCTYPTYSFVVTASTSPAASLDFDGVNDRVRLPLLSFPSNKMTVEAWIKPTDITTNGAYEISRQEGSPSPTWIFSFQNHGALLTYGLTTGGSYSEMQIPISPAYYTDGNWHHVAAVYDGAYKYIYTDGILIGKETRSGAISSGSATQHFIGSSVGLEYFKGSIDEVRYWNTARTACEIQSYMKCEIPNTATDLIANYHFNQGIPSGSNTSVVSLTDAAGVNTGTLVGFTLTGALSNWVNPGGVISGSIVPAVPGQTLAVTGSGNPVPAGSSAVSLTNLTDLGTAFTTTFVLQNTGTDPLHINNHFFSGANASNFSITVLPTNSIAASGSSSIVVSFTPGALGSQTAVLHVISSDCTSPNYSFVIQGTGVAGSAISFDGVNDYIDLGNSTILKPTAALTAEAWVNSSWASLDRTILGNTESSGYGLFTTAGGNLEGLVRRNSAFASVTTPLSGLSAGWHHVGLTYDGRYTRLYVDGVLASTNDAGAPYPIDYNAGNNTLIGGEASGGSAPIPGWFFPGKIDEVKIWNRALCQAELQYNMNCEISVTGNGLVANYHFNEGIASGSNTAVGTLPDFSGNNLTGNLIAMSQVGPNSNWVSPGAVTSGSSCAAFMSPEIDLSANGFPIAAGDISTSYANNTDFLSACSNSTIVRTFTVQNTGSAPLTVSTMSMSGPDAALFTIGALTPASPIAMGNQAVFSVTFTPVSAGARSATLNISNNDCNEGSYSFAITATANAIPIVTASISQSVICDGTAITVNGSGADTYTWTGGVTNAVSFTPVANQTYTLSGTYTLTGCTNSNLATTAVTVNPIPSVTITPVAATICSGNAATLTASGASTYTWNPGGLTGATITPSPGTSTTYSLVGTSAACISTNTANQLVTVNITPTLTSLSTNTAICNGFSTALSIGSADTYSWYPGPLNGATITVSPNTTTQYTAVGYSTAGCISSNSIVLTVTVNALPTVTANTTHSIVCDTYTTSLFGTGADTYTWTGGITDALSFTPTASGSYTVSGTYTLTGCTSTNIAVQGITVNPTPTLVTSTSGSVICNLQSTTLTVTGANTYTWLPGPLTGSNITVSPNATTIYSVTGTSTAGCTSTLNALETVSVNALPTVTASISNSVICETQSITLTGGGANTYTWTGGATDGVAFAPAANASYTLSGTNLANCTSTNLAVVSVTVNALPTVTANASHTAVCNGFTTSLSGSGASTYTWTGGTPTVSNGVAFTPTITTSYTVSGTNALTGCTSTNLAVQTITVDNTPTVTTSSSGTVICNGFSATLTAFSANSYTWMPGGTVGNSVVVSPSSTTIYTVTGTSIAGCTNTNLATETLSVNALPTVTASISNSVICETQSITLTGGGATTYTWTGGATDGVAFAPTANTSYTLSGTNLANCTSTNLAVVSVTVNALPTVTANTTHSIVCDTYSTSLFGSGADTYTWSAGITNGLAFVPTTTGSYTVSGTNALTGCTSTNMAVQGITVNPTPTVVISTTGSIICNGGTAALSATGADTYTWLPGPLSGNNVNVSPNATIIYSVTGTSTAGCTSTINALQTVSVNALPTVTASISSPTVCESQSVTLTGSGASTYTWTGGALDGIAFAPTANASYTLSGTNLANCTNTNLAVVSVTVHALPSVTANATHSIVCDTYSTSLFGTGADTYTWTGGVTDGLAFVPTATGSYTVSGTYTLTGCASTNIAVQGITVNPTPTLVTSTSGSVICNLQTATLTVTGADTYTWLPGPLTGSNVNVSPNSTTIYSVTGTSTAGCTSTINALETVSVNALPTVTASISNSVICETQTITVNGSGANTYTWTGGVNDGVSFAPTANASYSLSGTDLAGCTSTNLAVVSVTVHALPTLTVAITNSVICVGDQSTLNASGANTYTWSDGLSNNVAFSPTLSATYTVMATDLNTCTNTAVASITVNNLPVLTVTAVPLVSCEAQTTTLTVSGASTYSWSTSENTPDIVISPTATSVYTVNATDLNGCTNAIVYTQSVNPCPGSFTANATTKDVTCVGKNDGAIYVESSNTYTSSEVSYHWTPQSLCPNNDCDTLLNLKSGTYNLTVKITYTLNNILVKQDSIVMNPIVLSDLSGPCNARIFNGITPNGDGINDALNIENVDLFPNNSVTVFNRWGQKVYEVKGYNNLDRAWPVGADVGTNLSGTYFYIIDLGDGSDPLKGWIELSR